MLEVVELVKLWEAVVVQHDAVTGTEQKRGSEPARRVQRGRGKQPAAEFLHCNT